MCCSGISCGNSCRGAVLWLAGASIGGQLAAGAVASVSGLFFALGLNSGYADYFESFANNLAVRTVNLIYDNGLSLHWNSLLLNAKSIMGYVTAEVLRDMPEDMLVHVTTRIMKRLSVDEFSTVCWYVARGDSKLCKLKNRFSDVQLNEIKSHFKDKADIAVYKSGLIIAALKNDIPIKEATDESFGGPGVSGSHAELINEPVRKKENINIEKNIDEMD